MRPILVGHTIDLAAPPPTTTAVQAGASPGPAQPAQPRSLRFRRAGRGHGGRARRRRPSQPRSCVPHRRPPRPHPGRTQRTRERTDTGQPKRTRDTGHPDARTRALDTGRVDRHAWRDFCTRHWTDVDTLTKVRPASAAPGLPRPADARATQNGVLWAAPARLATMTARQWGQLPARNCLLPRRVAARSLRRLSRASAHCCPQTITGRA
jgi:hypothetical protein